MTTAIALPITTNFTTMKIAEKSTTNDTSLLLLTESFEDLREFNVALIESSQSYENSTIGDIMSRKTICNINPGFERVTYFERVYQIEKNRLAVSKNEIKMALLEPGREIAYPELEGRKVFNTLHDFLLHTRKATGFDIPDELIDEIRQMRNIVLASCEPEIFQEIADIEAEIMIMECKMDCLEDEGKLMPDVEKVNREYKEARAKYRDELKGKTLINWLLDCYARPDKPQTGLYR